MVRVQTIANLLDLSEPIAAAPWVVEKEVRSTASESLAEDIVAPVTDLSAYDRCLVWVRISVIVITQIASS